MAASLCMLLVSCGSYGPRSMDRDQFDYGNSIGDNWKNQMLFITTLTNQANDANVPVLTIPTQ